MSGGCILIQSTGAPLLALMNAWLLKICSAIGNSPAITRSRTWRPETCKGAIFCLPSLAKFLEHFRLAASRNEVRVKARCIDVVVAGDPIALRIEQALRQIGVGNPFFDEVLPLERD